MVATIGIANEALSAEEGEPSVLARIHYELVRAILAHGELVHADADDRHSLEQNVASLMRRSPDAGKAWELALVAARRANAVPAIGRSLDRLDDADTLQREWKGQIEVGFMEPERAELIGCPPGDEVWREPHSSIELARCCAPWQTTALARLRSLAEMPTIPPKSDRNDIADQRFVPLIKRAKRVVVLDRFLGINALKTSSGSHGELEWFLDTIDQHGVDVTLAIFTTGDGGAGNEDQTTAICRRFAEIWTGVGHRRGLTELKLFIGPDSRKDGSRVFKFPHDRHMRFDKAGYVMTSGLDRFRRETTRGSWSLSYVWQPLGVRRLIDEEDRARLATGAPPEIFN